MKKIFMAIALCLMCASLFNSCKSNEQKITETYVLEKDYPTFTVGAALLNAEIKSFSVENFNNTPTDTIFEWQVFETYTLKPAFNRYLSSIEEYGRSLRYYHIYSDFDRETNKNQMKKDSVSYADAETKLNEMKKLNEVRALGYEFDEFVKMKIAGQTKSKNVAKIIYIMDNGEVYSCEDR